MILVIDGSICAGVVVWLVGTGGAAAGTGDLAAFATSLVVRSLFLKELPSVGNIKNGTSVSSIRSRPKQVGNPYVTQLTFWRMVRFAFFFLS